MNQRQWMMLLKKMRSLFNLCIKCEVPEGKKVEALESALHDLEDQLNVYKDKIKEVYAKLNDSTKRNYELEEKIEALEDENREISDMVGVVDQGEGGTQSYMVAVGATTTTVEAHQ